MTLFDGLLFFLVMAALLLPAAVLGLCGKRLKWYGLAVTAVILALVFRTPRELITLAGFYLWQLLLCEGYLKVRKKSGRRPLLWLFLFLSAAPLILVKLGGLFHSLAFIKLIGISYMSFRALAVLIEIYDGLITEVGVGEFSYFLLFFPSVSSGPIDRYRRFVGDLEKRWTREEYAELLKKGVWKLMWGALCNFVLGNLIWAKWLSPLPASGFLPTLSYMYGYTFFLFFNFAGYSMMATGASYILGVKIPENFNMPFLSRDMKDFWSRWHISLSTWLRDYVYTRFVAASLKGEWFKHKRAGAYLGYMINMLTMGFWHGLTVGYIVYGAYHGVLLCLNEWLDTRKGYKKLKKQPWFEILAVLVTFHLFSFGLLIFSGRIL